MSAILNKPTPEGIELGRNLVRLLEPSILALIAQGEPDDRCKTCAFRIGTIPNGCPETLMDAMKTIMEGDVENMFYCHEKKPVGTKPCHGYFAGRHALKGANRKVPWDFSNPAESSAGR